MIHVKTCPKNPKGWGDTQTPISDEKYCEISSKSV